MFFILDILFYIFRNFFTVRRAALGRCRKDKSVLQSIRLHRMQRKSNIFERRISMYQILQSLFLDYIVIFSIVRLSWSWSLLSRTNRYGSWKTSIPRRLRDMVDRWYYTSSYWWIETRRWYKLDSICLTNNKIHVFQWCWTKCRITSKMFLSHDFNFFHLLWFKISKWNRSSNH